MKQTNTDTITKSDYTASKEEIEKVFKNFFSIPEDEEIKSITVISCLPFFNEKEDFSITVKTKKNDLAIQKEK